jgi:hypothetical protein
MTSRGSSAGLLAKACGWVLMTVLLASCNTAASSPATPKGSLAGRRENVVFWYQRVLPGTANKNFQHAYAVVVTGQGDTLNDHSKERQAVKDIRGVGALPFRYVNFFWFPKATLYNNFINISQHPGWRFCGKGGRPVVGQRVNGVKWYYFDANERSARAFVSDYLKQLKNIGYRGLFFDRGGAAFRGLQSGKQPVWKQRSHCTAHPWRPRARFSDLYASLIKKAKRMGFQVWVNYGKTPFTTPKLRPDPNNRFCRKRQWLRCPTKNDVLKTVSRVIDESPSHLSTRPFKKDYREDLASERHSPPQGPPRVIGEVKVPARRPKAVYYQWAKARLFRLSLFINTGDDGCRRATRTDFCWRWGTYPELTAVRLGSPLDSRPSRYICSRASKVKCLWLRRYRHGMSVVNLRNRSVTMPAIRTGVGSQKAVELRPGTNRALGCGGKLRAKIPARSGRVITYLHKC